MKITLEHIGRRFNREWIFKAIDYTFLSGQSYAILGPNGSGKSTLLQILSASLSPSEGKISFFNGEVQIDPDLMYRQLSIAAPYLELIEEFTLAELIDFHFGFKRYLAGFDQKEVIDLLGFTKARNKPLKYFSSGMKQRTKLALALCSDTPVLLLDEPASNLDHNGIAWYRDMIRDLTTNRLVIVGSNQEHEYDFCQSQLHLGDYKKW